MFENEDKYPYQNWFNKRNIYAHAGIIVNENENLL